MDLDSIKKSYRFYAPFYNLVFGHRINSGRKKVVRLLDQKPGLRVLEIGVGTGLSVPYYNQSVEITGIDVSTEMLDVARKKYPQDKFPQVKEFLEMDAQDLQFPDGSFDVVVAMLVVSVVPDPEKMLAEMARVCAPGGKIIVLNHFASQKGPMKKIENLIAPLSRRIGFRPDFCLKTFLTLTDRKLLGVHKGAINGMWKMIEFENTPCPQKEQEERAQGGPDEPEEEVTPSEISLGAK
ncbi:MAG: methyltransferase domain-containing protein [Opitutales bacterium]|nr:methyltransferase domain-containing protein [Opitutales bacterium]